MSTPALFLSYAREDAPSARRIAEALRAAGLEVWFDENELRGGDAWDAKIRRQIRECTLFLPVISAQTQARHEGYFRREWKLAVERMGDMAGGIAFLVPVVIDDTREADALVPDEFMRVHWTRLAGALPTPQFVEQVKRLLVSPRQTVGRGHRTPPESVEAAAAPARGAAGFGDPALQVRPASRWPLVLGGVAAVAIVAALFFAWRGSKPSQPVAGVADPGPAATKPATAVVAPAASPTPEADAKSIAVLPFANMSSDKDSEFFADGVHEDLLTALAKVRDLKVISRTSVMGYHDSTKRNLRQIARDLGVAHILEGSVRRAGNKARITVQLIDARTDQHLWAESYDRDVTDIFAVQGEVAREITTALKATLTPDEASLITRRLTANPRAYDLYVRARALEQNLQVFSSSQDYERITSLYAAAAEADPNFVMAHVQEAIAHGTHYWFASLDPSEARRQRAFAALARARALAPDAPEVHLAQGAVIYLCRNDWRGALEEFRLAQAKLPNDAQLLYRMGLTHRRLGEMVEAEQLFQRVVVLNPNDVRAVSALIETQVALRRYRAAVATHERYRTVIALDGQAAEFRLVAEYALSGDTAAFLRALAVAPARTNDPHGLNLAYNVAFLSGDLKEAERLLRDPRWETVLGLGVVVAEPKALRWAELAYLQGRSAEAARYADQAIAYFEGQTWTERQQPFARMGIARAMSCAGRHDEAVRLAREILTQQEQSDQFTLSMMRFWAGRVLIAADKPAEVLTVWRANAATPGSFPAVSVWLLDPYWARLRQDPRYAEIFQPVRSF